MESCSHWGRSPSEASGFRHWLEIASSLGPANDLVGLSLLLTTQLIDASRPSCRSRKALRSPPWGLCYIDANGHLELLWKCLGTTLWYLMVPPLLPFPLRRARSISRLVHSCQNRWIAITTGNSSMRLPSPLAFQTSTSGPLPYVLV